MTIPAHITDLTREDFQEIARAANMRGEDNGGVVIEPQGEKYVLRIDKTWLSNFLADYIGTTPPTT